MRVFIIFLFFVIFWSILFVIVFYTDENGKTNPNFGPHPVYHTAIICSVGEQPGSRIFGFKYRDTARVASAPKDCSQWGTSVSILQQNLQAGEQVVALRGTNKIEYAVTFDYISPHQE